ncbi:MAG: PAS domain-containing sensor histidine kinase, partial [Planctomycetota bacterium]
RRRAFLLTDGGEAVIRGSVLPPGEDAVRDRLVQRDRSIAGSALALGWLLVLAAGIVLLRRPAPFLAGPRRSLASGLFVLLLRALLAFLDLPGRFPALAAAFDPADFGIEDPLGWLASPADFALTALALLAAAVCFARAVHHLGGTPHKAWAALAAGGGVGLGALASALWVAAVGLAVAQGQTPFFESPTVVPPLAAALLLTGLVVLTAAAWVLASAGQVIAGWGLALPRRLLPTLAPVLASGALAWWIVGTQAPAWAPWLLPLATLPALWPGRPEGRAALPGTILLAGVLATLVLFPLLWERVLARGSGGLAATLDGLLRAEATIRSNTRFALENLQTDPDVVAGFRSANRGPAPEGLAFTIWLRSFLAQPGEHGMVSVLDRQGRRLEDFSLTPLPQQAVPDPAPPTPQAGDVQILTVRNEGPALRSIVGRARIRDPDDGQDLGTLVLTVPDRLDLVFLGPGALGRATGDASAPPGIHFFELEFAILEGEEVVRANTPTIARRRGGFGPPALAHLGPDRLSMAWQTGDEEGYAVYSPERDAVVAVRQERPGPADAVLALARLVAVGVGLACVVAILVLLLGLPRFRHRLQHRLFLSYFLFSFIPIVLLGLATGREIGLRHDAYLSQRLSTDLRRARSDLEAMGAQLFDQASSANLVRWAGQREHDILLYRHGRMVATSRTGLVEAEIIPAGLPADAWLATHVDRRELIRREGSFAGRPVWIGYAPILDGAGRPVATLGVPLLYDKDRIEEELAVAGSVLVAAYLFALVLVLVGGIFVTRRLTRPLAELAAGTHRVARGEWDVVLPSAGRDELGELVDSFNRMTRNLKEATERAMRAQREAAWQKMARQVAHEIKNPLTPIRLMIQQLEAEAARDPEEAPAAIQRTAPVVLRQIAHLDRIARDFAHFARMPQRTMEDVDVRALI